jgi:uncharacterized hydrophobic protein (TIGR00271 family)
MMNLLDKFKLGAEKEDVHLVHEQILHGIEFRGTNLWILIFAVFIASLGLNVNSTAVVIGAMLVSPLMGPIMGLGYGMAINDLTLLRKSFLSLGIAVLVGLMASTLFFILSPINDAHSEILARTSPNIYDVLIAFFGGLAGILAMASKTKGNVIPGVAIATALMPPLCTAGYGLATLQPLFFFGAFYLFLINTVFIALATLLTLRYLKFPFRSLPDRREEKRAERLVYVIVLITILPSIYFGYDMVRQNRFMQRANAFIERESELPNDYLLQKAIDPQSRSITLVFGGDVIPEETIESMRRRLAHYELEGTQLTVQQGFAFLQDQDGERNQLAAALEEKEARIRQMQAQLDSITTLDRLGDQLFRELRVQFPSAGSMVIQPVWSHSTGGSETIWLSRVTTLEPLRMDERQHIENWLKVRLGLDSLQVVFDP